MAFLRSDRIDYVCGACGLSAADLGSLSPRGVRSDFGLCRADPGREIKRTMMNDFLINMGINVVLTLLGQVIKNPASKESYRRAMLKIHNAIKLAFTGDPDFQ